MCNHAFSVTDGTVFTKANSQVNNPTCSNADVVNLYLVGEVDWVIDVTQNGPQLIY